MSRGPVLCAILILLCLPVAILAGVKGDLTDDGRVDSADALLLSRILRGDLDPSTLSPEDVADVYPILNATACGDGAETLHDLLLMLRALRGEDVDADGLERDDETILGTSPFLADTDADGHLDPSDPAPLVPTPPNLPSNRRVFDGPSDVDLTWSAGSGVDHYVVHRYGTDGSYEYFVLDGAALSFTDAQAQPGVVYRYWVQGVNGLGQEGAFVDCDITDPSNTTPWLTGALGPFPNPPFDANTSGTTVTFTWTESSEPSVTGYRIYSSTSPVPLGQTGDLALVATVPGKATTSHPLPGVSPGTHYFRMTAFSATEESGLASAEQEAVVVN